MREILSVIAAISIIFSFGPTALKSLRDDVLKALAEKHQQGFSSSEKFAQAMTGKKLEWTAKTNQQPLTEEN